MKYETVAVKTRNRSDAKLFTYMLDNYGEIDPERKRPVILICPGGGYRFTSDREAEAVAIRYAAMGYHACVLRYSVAPAEFPQALCELAWSVDYLRKHKEEYGISENHIFVAGFSAGGHLAASLGVYWKEKWLEEQTGLGPEEIRPNGLILSYPVITSKEYAHRESFENLMGGRRSAKLEAYLSLEDCVDKDVPPTFIWHTGEDSSVPAENTLLFAESLRKAKVPMEVHIFPKGEHGLSLANEETMAKSSGFGVQRHCQRWIGLSGEWIEEMLQQSGGMGAGTKKKGVIFDLDGVIVSTDKLHYQAWKRIADKLNVEFDETVNNRLRGVSRMDSLNIILEKYHGPALSGQEKEALAEEKNSYYVELLGTLSGSDVSEEVKETLKYLHSQGMLLAIGSSSKNAKYILKQIGLLDMFDAVSDGNNIARSKPDPEVFLKAAEFLRLFPEECIVVEDAAAGIHAAKKGNMQAIGMGDAYSYEKADYHIKSFKELGEILL